MIRILQGENDFAIEERLHEIKAAFSSPDTLEFNLAEYDASSFDPGEAFATAATPPFLADYRIIVIKNVLGCLDSAKSRRGASGGLNDKAVERILKIQGTEPWKIFAEMLKDPFPSTELIFVETVSLKTHGAALSVAPTAEIETFPRVVRWREINQWITERFKYRGGSAQPSAVSELYKLCGPNLRLMDNEIVKLLLYSDGRAVTQEDVATMVSDSLQSNIFQAIDAVVEHKPAIAMKSLYSLMLDRGSLSSILVMLARQVRLLILASVLKSKRLSPDEIGQRIGIRHEFLQRKILVQAGRFTLPQLKAIHQSLFDVEFAIKTGRIEQTAGLETLIARLSSDQHLPLE